MSQEDPQTQAFLRRLEIKALKNAGAWRQMAQKATDAFFKTACIAMAMNCLREAQADRLAAAGGR